MPDLQRGGEHRGSGHSSRGLNLREPFFALQQQVEPAMVKLFDLVRGLPQRVEAQFRRHWSFTPGLYNLYFREQVNLGISLSAVSRGPRPEENTQRNDNCLKYKLSRHQVTKHNAPTNFQGT